MTPDYISHLRNLIATPSFSRDEAATADIWEKWLIEKQGGEVKRLHNNVHVLASGFDPSKPILMLNSHHDTVRPSPSYSRDPFSPDIEGDRLYGLGSNDAGGSGVALAMAFLALKDDKTLPVNLLLAITAAEEVMGEHGMRAFLPYLLERGLYPDMVIVGEPTGMQPAIAERGLLVLDCVAKGKAGHAARNEGINALYRAMEDIESLRCFNPAKTSEILGPIKVNVTMIQCGTQHNVVPDTCTYVADIRTTDAYSNEDTVKLLKESVKWSEITPRSTRVHASVIDSGHPLVKAAVNLGKTPFISPTTSDMALMHDIPSLKIGPGESARSHSADEFICLSEIEDAIHTYIKLIKSLKI
ncbi:MAG: M20/M25/M40 family metallo-hydrolase [Muribaculaceae bacterium]|nr:M20/M25/M40 family metallo-hydrolase [Muribaculaceae bacterium]MDE6551870.1 M20/M25/M40 family metallo-hydrolase [Muribaculaceae bacterium]